MYSLMAGLILLSFASFSWFILRDFFHPSLVFTAIWGVGLCAISLTPNLGFFEVESDALLLFVAGGLVFCFASMGMERLLSHTGINTESFFYSEINYKKVFFTFALLHMLILPFALADLQALGDSFEQIAYAARAMSVSGDAVFGKITSNYLLMGLVLIPLMLKAVATKKISFTAFLIISVPWCIFILIGTGRAALIQMLLGLLIVYHLSSGRLPIKVIIVASSVLGLVLIAGAVATNKVDLSANAGLGEMVFVFLRHLAGYALQGPILFSLYFDKIIDVFPNWSPFVSFCHLLSALQMCTPQSVHADFNQYGPGLDGNVYSIYFSIYPNFGAVGALVFLTMYSLFSTYIYFYAKSGNLLCLVISAYLYSASVLSLFSDTFLPSLWFFIKILCVVIAVLICFSVRSRSLQQRHVA